MKKRIKSFGIQSILMSALTALTIITTTIIVALIYIRYDDDLKKNTIKNMESLINSSVESFEDYLLNMRRISDAINYNIIQQYDINSVEFSQQLDLLYQTNKDRIRSISVYDNSGRLLAVEPAMTYKQDVDITNQDWFIAANSRIENMHFSSPHIENYFVNDSDRYYWVMSLSRFVNISDGDKLQNGVLLIDINYSNITESFDEINETQSGQYYYLCKNDGEVIYHPYGSQILRGIKKDESINYALKEDGTYYSGVNGKKSTILVKTISYTGWKLVGVVSFDAHNMDDARIKYFILTTFSFLLMMILVLNRIIVKRISKPILKLNDSVKEYEAGDKPNIYIGGSSEIRHLGYSVQKSYEQIDELMREIVRQQNERRKSEIAALQSQINPHFLYNTLESITWMVEGNKNKEAVFMISELAKLLRISLSKGHTIISIQDELQHCRSYMNIQKFRYNKRFSTEFDIDPEINDYVIVKLIIQPILENAIYYGVGNLDEDDGGKILVTGRIEHGDIYISVEDNGMGMREEDVANILVENNKVPKHGSGVGLINVHTRIKLMFGEAYGLIVESEPDEGTKVTVHLPAILYDETERDKLESMSELKRDKLGETSKLISEESAYE